MEASAKTNVGVKEAFLELVERVSTPYIVLFYYHINKATFLQILDTPSLWAPAAPRTNTTTTATKSQTMPGSIDLSAPPAGGDQGGGCSC